MSLPSLPTLEHLYIHDHILFPRDEDEDDQQNFPEDIQWLWPEILCRFTSVKKLYLYKKLAFPVLCALQGLYSDNVTGLLPALSDIYFPSHESMEPSGAILEAIGEFVATLQLSGRSVSVHCYQGGNRAGDQQSTG